MEDQNLAWISICEWMSETLEENFQHLEGDDIHILRDHHLVEVGENPVLTQKGGLCYSALLSLHTGVQAR